MSVNLISLSSGLASTPKGMDLLQGVPENENRGKSLLAAKGLSKEQSLFEKHLLPKGTSHKALVNPQEPREHSANSKAEKVKNHSLVSESKESAPKKMRTHSSAKNSGALQVDKSKVNGQNHETLESVDPVQANVDPKEPQKMDATAAHAVDVNAENLELEVALTQVSGNLEDPMPAAAVIEPKLLKDWEMTEQMELPLEPVVISDPQGQKATGMWMSAELPLNSEAQVETGESELKQQPTDPLEALLKEISEEAVSELKPLANQDISRAALKLEMKPISNQEDALEEESSLEIGSSSEQSLGDESMLAGEGMEGLSKSEQPLNNLKQWTDSLWVSNNLDGQTINQNISFKDVLVGKSIALNAPNVRANLVEDMQPLVSKVQWNQSGGEMTLNLRPAQLGQVRIHVEVEDGNVKVAFQAQQESARSMLSTQVRELKQQLQSQGLRVDEISISSMAVSSADASRPSSQEPKHEQGTSQNQDHHQQKSNNQERGGRNENPASSSKWDFAELFLEKTARGGRA